MPPNTGLQRTAGFAVCTLKPQALCGEVIGKRGALNADAE